jgi:ubiquitin
MGQDANAPAGSSGHYEFDAAGFENVITQVKACITKVLEIRAQAMPMTQVLPMGNEPSSKDAAAGINASGNNYLAYNKDLENYYTKLKDDLTKARDTYLAQEQHASETINKTQRNS